MGRSKVLTAVAVFDVIFLLLGTANGLKEGDKCQHLLEINGTCTTIEKCISLNKELQEMGIRMFIFKTLAKARKCGRQNGEELICCTPSLKYQLTKHTDDVSQHPNIGLLRNDICGPVYQGRIYDGYTAGLFELPWIALLISKSGNINISPCAGSIINDRYILTAGHCTDRWTLNYVRLGEFSLDQDPDCVPDVDDQIVCAPRPQEIPIEEIIPYQNFGFHTNNDIALIRLSQPANFSDAVCPICLPIGLPQQTKSLIDKMVNISSWGLMQRGRLFKTVQKVTVPVMKHSSCLMSPTEDQICLGSDSCQGDVGAPITYIDDEKGGMRTFQYGIVSSKGPLCGFTEIPESHAHVGYYMKWILDNMKP